MGKPGVGKTHLANATGLEALNQGHKVLFAHANYLLDKLLTARAGGAHRRLIASFVNTNFLIIDGIRLPKNSPTNSGRLL